MKFGEACAFIGTYLRNCFFQTGRTVLQMDQAAFSYQDILWHDRERCEDTDMDYTLSLCVGGNYKKATEPGVVRKGEPS